jgi:hypothetical protein
MISAQRAPNLPFGRQLRMRSVVPYWNDEHEICRVAAATADPNGKRIRFFWLTQRAVGQMLRQGSGHVVNVTLKPLPQHRSICYRDAKESTHPWSRYLRVDHPGAWTDG